MIPPRLVRSVRPVLLSSGVPTVPEGSIEHGSSQRRACRRGGRRLIARLEGSRRSHLSPLAIAARVRSRASVPEINCAISPADLGSFCRTNCSAHASAVRSLFSDPAIISRAFLTVAASTLTPTLRLSCCYLPRSCRLFDTILLTLNCPAATTTIPYFNISPFPDFTFPFPISTGKSSGRSFQKFPLHRGFRLLYCCKNRSGNGGEGLETNPISRNP